MCGIAGLVSFQASQPATQRALVQRMGDALAHRGPDERGSWVDGPVALAARRLRIVDLATGQQPMSNEDGTLRLVANGEIYNADDLRSELRRRGHTFASLTDTEVILHAYEEYGSACLERLEGMFAFALWDRPHRRLFLARDRFGEKPLYYAHRARIFLFASELKALLVHPDVARELDWSALARYLTHEYVPSPHSIFHGIRKLPPAHSMVLGHDGQACVERYWSVPSPSSLCPSKQEASEQLLSMLETAVKKRIPREVPWGTYLSGGLDSRLVTAIAARGSPGPINTFSIGFEESSYDERGHARTLARALGAEHREIVLRPEDAVVLLPDVARVFDEPFADATGLPALLLARLARRDVTVVLSGDGSDEILCGYPTHTAHAAATVYWRLPSPLRRAIAAAASRLPASHRYLSFDFVLRRFLRDAERPAAERHLRWMGSFAPEALPQLLTPDVRNRVAIDDPYSETYAHIASIRPASASDVATALDLLLYLPEDNLVQSDRSSMSAGLEIRAPFLDRALAEYALRLPEELRRGFWKTKPLLRRGARPMLPRRIVRRPKHGFGVPTGGWLRGPLRSHMLDLLSPARLRRQGIFDASYVHRLVTAHLGGLANHRKELWTLFMFQVWTTVYGAA